jgi:hypothetical protein
MLTQVVVHVNKCFHQESSDVTLDQSSGDQTHLRPSVINVYYMSSGLDLYLVQ